MKYLLSESRLDGIHLYMVANSCKCRANANRRPLWYLSRGK